MQDERAERIFKMRYFEDKKNVSWAKVTNTLAYNSAELFRAIKSCLHDKHSSLPWRRINEDNKKLLGLRDQHSSLSCFPINEGCKKVARIKSDKHSSLLRYAQYS